METNGLESVELEKYVLGHFISNAMFRDLCIERGITYEYFTLEVHRIIYFCAHLLCIEVEDLDDVVFFTEIKKLKMDKLPWVSRNSKLKDRSILSYIGGNSILLELTSSYSSENVSMRAENWLKSLSDIHSRIRAIKMASRLIEDLKEPNGRTTSEIIASFELSDESDSIEMIDSGTANKRLIEKVNNIAKEGRLVTGIRSGIDWIDRKIGDIELGRFVAISADPSSGKTILATHFLAEASIRNGIHSIFFNLEMYADEMMERLYGMLYEVNFKRLKMGMYDEYFYKIKEASKFFKSQPITICEKNDLNIDQIRVKCRAEKRKNKDLKCIFIDHMALLSTHNPRVYHRYEINTHISRTCKAMAKELNCVVFLVCQHSNSKRKSINTDEEYKSPQPADIEFGTTVYQDANIVIQIGKKPISEEREICITKLRDGSLGKIWMPFEGQYVRFKNIM